MTLFSPPRLPLCSCAWLCVGRSSIRVIADKKVAVQQHLRLAEGGEALFESGSVQRKRVELSAAQRKQAGSSWGERGERKERTARSVRGRRVRMWRERYAGWGARIWKRVEGMLGGGGALCTSARTCPTPSSTSLTAAPSSSLSLLPRHSHPLLPATLLSFPLLTPSPPRPDTFNHSFTSPHIHVTL
eukprot:2254535-Rhodomonas_salina.3